MDTTTPADLTATDEAHLRHAFDLAQSARDAGNRPFGALLVGGDGSILAEGANDAVTTGDVTGHAEMHVVRQIVVLRPAGVATATLYASTEPCVMCTGALFLAGVKRIVFGFPESDVRRLSGSRSRFVNLPFGASFILGEAAVDVEVLGPTLIDEAATAHQGFWA